MRIWTLSWDWPYIKMDNVSKQLARQVKYCPMEYFLPEILEFVNFEVLFKTLQGSMTLA